MNTKLVDIQKVIDKSNLGIKGMMIIIFIEYKAYANNVSNILAKFIQPLIYLFFLVAGIAFDIGDLSFNGIQVSYVDYCIPGIVAIMGVNMMSHVIYRSTIDKRWGLLALKYLNGIKPIYYLLGMSLFPFLILSIQSVLLSIIGTIFFHAVISLKGIVVSFFIVGLTAIFWSSVAILITNLINNYQQRDLVISLMMYPLMFSAPCFYSLQNAPQYIKVISLFNPLTYQSNAIREAWYGSGIMNTMMVLLITIISIIIYLWAQRKFKLITNEH